MSKELSVQIKGLLWSFLSTILWKQNVSLSSLTDYKLHIIPAPS